METISISEYDYLLPDEKIAKYPLDNRELSGLLVYNKGKITNNTFSDLHQFIPENSLLVFNNTRVIQARLQFKKQTGAEIEIFCLEPSEPADYYQSFQQNQTCTWKCLIGNSKKWKEGTISLLFNKNDLTIELKAERIADYGEWQQIKFSWNNSNISFGEILEIVGKTPIPPYLHRDSENIDKSRYQTIYSLQNGSVAAPTAGLHFTPAVFERLENKNIKPCGITLHVGACTFRPVKEENAALHVMHTEHFFVKKDVLEQLLKFENNITAVGTTSMRTLESIYHIGTKIVKKQDNPFFIGQWEVYNSDEISVKQSIESLLNYCITQNCTEIAASTQIMIVPDYKFKMVQRLITNFHQPKSTLLLLIAAFTGKDKWKGIYNHALENNYRFLSYGDSSLLIP